VRTPRLALASVAAGGALVMGTVLALPAAADPNLPCQEHPGYTCTAHNEGAVGLHVAVAVNDLAALRARVNLNTPCADVAGLLVQAQLGVRTAHKTVVSDQLALNKARQDVRDAQKADEHAQAVRNNAITAANTAYNSAVAAAPADNPATPLVNEHQVALDKALKDRDAAVAAANNAYTSGGTATTLTSAKAAERAAEAQCAADRSAETVAAGLVVTLRTNLINCRIPVPTPAPTTEPAPVPVPAPVVVAPQPPDVFINPAQPSVIVNNPQVGVIPQGPAPTGAVDSADRYLG
jgi:hypothetical protein